MQGNDAAKKLVAKNHAKLINHLIAIGVIQGLYALGGWWRGVRLFVGLSTAVLQWACLAILFQASRPSGAGAELKATADLGQGWWVYLFDVIYVTSFAQLGSLISGWFHLAFLSIPIYGIYAALGFLQSLSKLPGMMPQQDSGGQGTQKERKKYRAVR
jgi:hypothetical protein